jgi:hypothetical protein
MIMETTFETREDICVYLNELQRRGDPITVKSYSVERTENQTVFMDGGYKKKPVLKGTEFFFTGARTGARGRLVLEFAPVDAQPFEKMEMRDNEVDGKMPGFAAAVAGILGGDALETVVNIAHRKEERDDWMGKPKKTPKSKEDTAANSPKATETVVEATSENYKDNSMWGAF